MNLLTVKTQPRHSEICGHQESWEEANITWRQIRTIAGMVQIPPKENATRTRIEAAASGQALTGWRNEPRVNSPWWRRRYLKAVPKRSRTASCAAALTVAPLSRKSTDNTPSWSQYTVVITWPTDGRTLNFLLRGEPWCLHVSILGVLCWTHVPSPLKMRSRMSWTWVVYCCRIIGHVPFSLLCGATNIMKSELHNHSWHSST